MAKIVQVLTRASREYDVTVAESQVITRPAKEYDYTVAESQTRDLDSIVEKLNTTYQQDLKDEVEAFNFFLN